MACWSTKLTISLKRVKIEEKLLWRAYRKSRMLFRTVPLATPTPLLFLDWRFATPTHTSNRYYLRTACKATDFKFGQYIHRVHPNKSPLKILEKRARAYPETVQIFPVRVPPPIISGTGKAMNFQFCTHGQLSQHLRLSRNKSPLKISGKVAMGVVRDSRKFSGHPYIHAGRIAIALLSCLTQWCRPTFPSNHLSRSCYRV